MDIRFKDIDFSLKTENQSPPTSAWEVSLDCMHSLTDLPPWHCECPSEETALVRKNNKYSLAQLSPPLMWCWFPSLLFRLGEIDNTVEIRGRTWKFAVEDFLIYVASESNQITLIFTILIELTDLCSPSTRKSVTRKSADFWPWTFSAAVGPWGILTISNLTVHVPWLLLFSVFQLYSKYICIQVYIHQCLLNIFNSWPFLVFHVVFCSILESQRKICTKILVCSPC